MEDQDEGVECHACGGPLVYLGVLGTLVHFRCRDCGLMQDCPAIDLADD